MLTTQELLNNNFTEKNVNGITIYTKNNYAVTYLRDKQVWAPCHIANNEVTIGRIYINTLKELNDLILEAEKM